MAQVRNVRDFAGALALDKWTCNANGRQVAFWKKGRERKFTVSFIDQGYCFNAGEWSFPDAPLRGVFGRNDVYASVTGWESFEPWLSRIETFPESSVWALAEEIPPEWYGGEAEELEQLAAEVAGAEGASAGVDRVVSGVVEESVWELERSGELGRLVTGNW